MVARRVGCQFCNIWCCRGVILAATGKAGKKMFISWEGSQIIHTSCHIFIYRKVENAVQLPKVLSNPNFLGRSQPVSQLFPPMAARVNYLLSPCILCFVGLSQWASCCMQKVLRSENKRLVLIGLSVSFLGQQVFDTVLSFAQVSKYSHCLQQKQW